MVVAHCDDEIIMGFPILQQSLPDLSILCCTSDRNNPNRKKWRRRSEAFYSLCSDMNINCKCLDYDSGFYKTESRNGNLSAVISNILENIMLFNSDTIYTHNAWGEYGHLDHMLVSSIVTCNFHKVITSDIFIPSNWTPYKSIHTYQYAGCPEIKNDIEKYNAAKKYYDNIHCWTWNKEPVKKCKIKM